VIVFEIKILKKCSGCSLIMFFKNLNFFLNCIFFYRVNDSDIKNKIKKIKIFSSKNVLLFNHH